MFRRPKKKPRGRWVWEPKAEGRANHYLDVLVGIYALADMKNCRSLPARDVAEAQLSRSRAQDATRSTGASHVGGGVRTPDGRKFFATQR